MMHVSKRCILIINTGSSSVKFQLFRENTELTLLAKGQIHNLGTKPEFVACVIAQDDSNFIERLPDDCQSETAIRLIIDWIAQQNQAWQINVVAHRVVHGGLNYTQSTIINDEVLTQLRTLNPLAPLHQPHNLAAITVIRSLLPNTLQIACFDTAFHAHHTPLYSQYALPQWLRDKGIRRYGFHGLSYEWIVHSLQQHDPKLASGKIIAAHLGNGASLCAIKGGISIDTTMGMTALDGLPMGTRCGNLDPGIGIYMARELRLSPAEIESILYKDSGLLGLSGLSNDVAILQESAQAEAQFALDFFCLRTAQLMGMMAVSVGGIDGIIFTGGIGENSEFVRNKILDHMRFLQPFMMHIIPANEERMMAMHSIKLIK